MIHYRLTTYRLVSVLLLSLIVLLSFSALLYFTQKAQANPDSFTDNFSSLDGSVWGTAVSGNGSVGVSGGKLVVDAPAVVGDAAIAYLKTEIDTTKSQLYELGHVLMDPGASRNLAIRFMDYGGAVPTVDTYANIGGNIRVQIVLSETAGTLQLAISYQDSVGTYHYWSTASNTWVLPAATYVWTSSTNDEYYAYMQTKNGYWRAMLADSANGRWRAITDWVAFSDLQSPYNHMYLVIGDTWTDYHWGETDIDFFDYYDGRTTRGYFNGCGRYGTAQDEYRIGKADLFSASFGAVVMPYRDAVLDKDDIPAPYTGSGLVTPYTVSYNGTDYIFVTNRDGSGNYIDIWYFTTTDEGDNITRPQDTPLVENTGGGWMKTEVLFPVVFRDTSTTTASERWKMYIAAHGDDSIWRIGLFTAPDPPVTGNWTWTANGGNPIISENNTPGAWNRYGTMPIDISGTSLYASGADNTTPLFRWVSGLYTTSDYESWSDYGGNPVFSAQDTKIQYLTANLASGDTSVNVTDSSVFIVGEPVLIYDDDAATRLFDLNRVSALPDATHVTLEKGADRNYTTADNASIRAITSWSNLPTGVRLSTNRQMFPIFNMMFTGYTNYPMTEMTGLMTSTDDTNWTVNNRYTPSLLLGDSNSAWYASAESFYPIHLAGTDSPAPTPTPTPTTTTPASSRGVGYWMMNTLLPIVIAAVVLLGVFMLTGNPIVALVSAVVGLVGFFIIQSIIASI